MKVVFIVIFFYINVASIVKANGDKYLLVKLNQSPGWKTPLPIAAPKGFRRLGKLEIKTH
jgi:hypothetical protein